MASEVSAGDVTLRASTLGEIPRLAELILGGGLPPLFIAEYIDGFVSAERSGVVIGCGGLEMYETCAVIRSVVVAPEAQGLGLGAAVADWLEAEARRRGATDIYLFTAEALGFWTRRRYVETGLDGWPAPPRLSWQYQFISQNLDLVGEVHAMRRTA